MTRRAMAWWLLLAATFPAAAAEVGAVATSQEGSVRRVDAWLPGRVQSAVVLTDDRGPAIWLYIPFAAAQQSTTPSTPVTPGSDPCAAAQAPHRGELWRFDPDAATGPRLERVLASLSSKSGTMEAFDLAGPGAPELLALLQGGIYRLPTTPGGTAVPLFEDAAFSPRTSFLTSFPGERSPLLAVADLGVARYLRFAAGRFESVREVELPVEAIFRRQEFRLGTRPTIPIGTFEGLPAYADQPEAIGKQRLRGRLVRPTASDDTVMEWWARLPEPEEMIEMRYLEIGGEPALFMTTRPANKLNLFGEKRLRLFRLAKDRSQTGHRPFFAVDTRANLWQSIVPYVRDVDGDGHDDLILAYWKGLTDARIVLDAYLSDGAGSYRRNPGTTGFDVKKGERSFVSWSHDVTGNGVTDLLVLGRGRLQVHAGDPNARRGRDLVETRPAHEILVVKGAKGDEEVEVDVEFGRGGMEFEGEELSSRGTRLIDVDGDGVFEALFSVPVAGTWKISFVRFGVKSRPDS